MLGAAATAVVAGLGTYAYRVLYPERPLSGDVKRLLRRGMLLHHTGKPAEARPLLARAVERTVAETGADSWQTASVAGTAGRLMAEGGDCLHAGEHLMRGWSLMLRQGRVDQAAAIGGDLGGCLVDLGEFTTAVRFLTSQDALLEEHQPAMAPQRAHTRHLLGQAQLGAGMRTSFSPYFR